MPTINLNIPQNSKFHSSLNEIDLAMREIYLKMMRIADPRSLIGKQDTLATPEKDDYLWNKTRVFQVDAMDTEEIFNTFLLRQKINHQNNINISYPILAFKENSIEDVFWGTGNRYHQWHLDILPSANEYTAGTEVVIKFPMRYRGKHGLIKKVTSNENRLTFVLSSLDGKIIPKDISHPNIPYLFSEDEITFIDNNAPQTYKAKPITATYETVILCDNRDEIQYLRDQFILKCTDANIWFKYKSPTLNGNENQIFTVFDIPNIESYPAASDKLKGKGYIYGTAFKTHVWACLTDKPIPNNTIESIRMKIKVENVDKTHRIVISE